MSESVGPGENYQPSAAAALWYIGGGRVHDPFLSQSPYTGFRVMLDDGPHFGWVQWDFREGPLQGGGTVPMYQPIRWAYETEPNTPITVPTIPSAALLLTAASALASRRRRTP